MRKSCKFYIPLPKIEEQVTIANFLDRETDRIDALIAEQERLIELLKEKRQAVISHAVTKGLDPTVPMKDSGVEWLGEVPAHWKTVKLRHLIETRKGFAFNASHFSDHGVPVVKASDIKAGSIKESATFIDSNYLVKASKSVLKQGNIILSTVGSNPRIKNSAVGQIGEVPDTLDGALLNQNTVIFESNSSALINSYLLLILQGSAYRDHLDLHAHGTANQSSLRAPRKISD